MCKLNRKNKGMRIDPCMKDHISFIRQQGYRTVGSCCGHSEFPMTIVVENLVKKGTYREIFSGIFIPRKRRFYKKNKQGYYYIPEVINTK